MRKLRNRRGWGQGAAWWREVVKGKPSGTAWPVSHGSTLGGHMTPEKPRHDTWCQDVQGLVPELYRHWYFPAVCHCSSLDSNDDHDHSGQQGLGITGRRYNSNYPIEKNFHLKFRMISQPVQRKPCLFCQISLRWPVLSAVLAMPKHQVQPWHPLTVDPPTRN